MRNKLLFSFLFLTLFYPTLLRAQPLKVLFFSPGSEGNQELAKPHLDDFLKSLNIAGLEFTGTYQNSLSQGVREVASQKFDLIISYPYLVSDSYETLAKTIPTSESETQVTLYLLGNFQEALVYSKQTFSKNYRDSTLIKKFNLNPNTQFERPENSIISKMRLIGMNKLKACVMITKLELNTLEKLPYPWVKEILKNKRSISIPSPVLSVKANLSPQLKEKITQAFLTVHESSPEKLEMLRLKKFAK